MVLWKTKAIPKLKAMLRFLLEHKFGCFVSNLDFCWRLLLPFCWGKPLQRSFFFIFKSLRNPRRGGCPSTRFSKVFPVLHSWFFRRNMLQDEKQLVLMITCRYTEVIPLMVQKSCINWCRISSISTGVILTPELNCGTLPGTLLPPFLEPFLHSSPSYPEDPWTPGPAGCWESREVIETGGELGNEKKVIWNISFYLV